MEIKFPMIYALGKIIPAYNHKVHNTSSNLHRELFDWSVDILNNEITSFQESNKALFGAVERLNDSKLY